jgi:hypothetical protein
MNNNIIMISHLDKILLIYIYKSILDMDYR